MDLDRVRSLVTVAQHGVITEAASALGLTQPALSRRIQQLEAEFGAPLLERSRKGVVLTEAGRLVEREARVMLERYARLKEQVRAHQRLDAGVVRLGGGATAIEFLMPTAIARFQAAHPGIRFRVKEAGSREVEGDVLDERLDLGIVTLPTQSSGLDVTVLRDDRIVLVAARTHPLARRRRVVVDELVGQDFIGFEAGSAIRQIIDATLRAVGVEMNVVMELRSIPAMLRMVATTGILAFVSEQAVADDAAVRVLPVPELRMQRTLALVSKRGAPLAPAVRGFVELLLRRGE
ncbi:MAG: LysR family transcriptional regulator [Ectothiorhodospiraceae bacterium]|nr:LysR family transcriptional regulator [Ectothiorhodospiraceae bacterium]